MTHLVDNGHDRALGEKWERGFCSIALKWGRALTPHQIGRKDGAASWYVGVNGRANACLLPDVTIWSGSGEHHEIKHKDATRKGCYGLEAYRLNALADFAIVTRQPVLYTIHDWRLAGATRSDDEMPNRIEHWLTVPIADLLKHLPREQPMPTWRNGSPDTVPGYYWPTDLWVPLDRWWVF